MTFVTQGMTVPCRYGSGSRPRVLVAFASRRGSTREIAATLARGLAHSGAGTRSGLSVALAPVELHPDPADFDAVVLGSAVYEGRWLGAAVRYAGEMVDELRGRPTWLFSTGLSGDTLRLPDEVDDARVLGEAIGACGHQRFAGRLERRLLSTLERDALVATPRAAGDFRDWRAVRAWAERIASDAVVRGSVAATG